MPINIVTKFGDDWIYNDGFKYKDELASKVSIWQISSIKRP